MTTKEHILETATDAFAAKGFSGVRIDELARDAGINKATLYYHFKSKQEIFESVMERQFRKLWERLSVNVEAVQTPESKLGAFIDTMFGRKRRDVVLIVREIIEGGVNLPVRFTQTMEQIHEILYGILKSGKDEGVFLRDDPHEVMAVLIGISDFYILGAPMREKMEALHATDASVKIPEDLRARAKTLIVDMLKH